MLERSFLVLPGIGDKRERLLWKQGILDWADYRNATQVPGVSNTRRKEHHRELDRLQDAWQARDVQTLARALPSNEHWRFFDALGGRAGYLDIETTGTHHGATTTVLGIYDAAEDRLHQLVQGDGLDTTSATELLARFDLFVTFHGAGFDLPFLRNEFPGSVPDIPHLDLRSPLARLGYRGGLKRIERDLGLARPGEVAQMTGLDAVRLWNRHRRQNDPTALETLLRYNAEDVLQMRSLATFAAAVLHGRLSHYWGGPPRPIPWPSGRLAPLVPYEVQEVIDRVEAHHGSLRQVTLDDA